MSELITAKQGLTSPGYKRPGRDGFGGRVARAKGVSSTVKYGLEGQRYDAKRQEKFRDWDRGKPPGKDITLNFILPPKV